MKLSDYKKSPKEFIQGVRSDGFRVGLSTAFAPWISAFFREKHGGTWFGQGRMWAFDRSKINGAFAASLAENLPSGILYDVGQFAQKLRLALASPDPDLFAPFLDVQIFPVESGDFVCLSRFDPLLVSTLQGLQGTFLRNRNAWRVKVALPRLLEVLETQAGIRREHIFLSDTEIVLEQHASMGEGDRPGVQVGGMVPERVGAGDAEGENAMLSVIATPMKELWINEADLAKAVQAYGLHGEYAYQEVGVRHLLRYSSCLLADDMGLGKSRQAVVAASLVRGPGAVLVVCPASLRINWEREIHIIQPDAKVVICGDGEAWSQADWLIVNYERLGAVVQAMSDGDVRFRVMLCDEAHYLKEPDSTRTRNAFLLSKHIERRFLLTATPVLNRESELHTLLRLSGHPIGAIPLGDFLSDFAGSPELRKALSERVSEWMLRRRKDVLASLKGKRHEFKYVDLATGERDQYLAAVSDNTQTAIVKIGKIRQLLERLKASWLIDTITSLGDDDKSIIFCEYTESVAYLADEFAKAGIQTVTFTGSNSGTRKQKAIDTFMSDPAVKVFIGTTKAAGVGLNLVAANHVFFASLPWTAAAKRQAEDRAYRNGQKRAVTVLMPVISGTIDEQVVLLLQHKESIEQDLLDDSVQDPGLVEEQMAAKLFNAA